MAWQRLWTFGLRRSRAGFAYVLRPPDLDLLAEGGIARLRATIESADAELVVLDSLRRAAPGLDENDSRAVSGLFSALRGIARELGCSIVVIHHPRKPVGDAKIEALYAARGSGDLTGSVDSYLFFRKLAGGAVRIEHGKARRGREHEHVLYRVREGDDGEPVLEQIEHEAAEGASYEEIREAELAWLRANPEDWHSTSDVRRAVKGRSDVKDQALRGLYEEGLIRLSVAQRGKEPLLVAPEDWKMWGDSRTPRFWRAHGSAESGDAVPAGATRGVSGSPPPERKGVAESPQPRRGSGSAGDSPAEGQQEPDDLLTEKEDRL